jgi:DNA-damage-inducible protein J
MTVLSKKRVQVQIDAELTREVEEILEALGLNPTTAITAYYKRIAATGEVPFTFSLTEEELALHKLQKTIRKKYPNPRIISTDAELESWLDEDE